MIRSANSEVDRLPVRNQIILGGNPLRVDMSVKSESKVTTAKPLSLANCHITESLQSFRPTDRTWQQSEKLSGSKRIMRNEMFWSNSNFMSGRLQSSFTLRCKSKAGKNIVTGKFREVGKNFIVCHTSRQPTQHIVNSNAGFPNTRFAETLFGIDCDNIIIKFHNNRLLNNYSANI